MEPVAPTNNANLEGLVGFPWLLEFSRRKAEDESGMLAFLNHHVLFDSFWRQCINLGIEDIWIAELNFTPSSLCCMNVTSVGKWVSLRSAHLVDLSAIAEEEPKEADVLASLDPDRNQQAEHGDGEDYEYNFESGIALDARSSLSLLHLEQGSQAGLCAMADSPPMVAPRHQQWPQWLQ